MKQQQRKPQSFRWWLVLALTLVCHLSSFIVSEAQVTPTKNPVIPAKKTTTTSKTVTSQKNARVAACTLAATVSNKSCFNSGTSAADDDKATFTINLTATGDFGGYCQVLGLPSGTTGITPGTPKVFEKELLISSLPVTLTIKAGDGSCETTVVIDGITPCSPICTWDPANLNPPYASSTITRDCKGTADEGDDTVSGVFTVSGVPAGYSWDLDIKMNDIGTQKQFVSTQPFGTNSAPWGPVSVATLRSGYPTPNGFVLWFMVTGITDCLGDYFIAFPDCSVVTCTVPNPAAGPPQSVCEDATASITATGCTSGYTLKWYDDAGLTNEVGTGSPFTIFSVSATTTYYAACENNTNPSCKSATPASVLVTMKPLPTITAGTPTCNAAGTTYSVTVTATPNSVITATAGTVSGNTVSGVPSGTTLTIIATLAGCPETTEVTFTCPAAGCNLNPALGAITCTGGISTPDKADDAFDFVLTVTGVGGASNLWEAVYNGDIIQTGTYGETKTINIGYAIYNGATSMTVTVRDKDNPTCTKTVTVAVPNCSSAPCTGFEFTNYVVTCTGTGLYKICFNVVGTAGRKWAASLKTSDDFTVAGIPIATGTGNQTNVCYTITASDFTTLQAFSANHFILWGMLELADGTMITGDGCEIDYTVPYSPCCTNPTAGTPVATQATCNVAGTVANNDAKIDITGIGNATVYAYTTDGTTPAFAGATAVVGTTVNLTALANPAVATTYKFRFFNGSAICFTDVSVVLNPKVCTVPCSLPDCLGAIVKKN